MVKNHLKRLNAPKRWKIKRKGIIFVKRANPGPHNMEISVPLLVVIRDMLKHANTARETKNILQNKTVLVNGIRRKETGFPVGLFDAVEIKEVNEYYRMILDKKGKISMFKTDKSDTEVRPAKIKNKTKLKGKVQLNLFDGNNILVDKDDYKTADTLVLSVPKNEIKKKIEFGKKVLIFLVGGKHIGEIGSVEDIKGNKITYKIGSDVFETSKEYAFVIGEDKPVIKIAK